MWVTHMLWSARVCSPNWRLLRLAHDGAHTPAMAAHWHLQQGMKVLKDLVIGPILAGDTDPLHFLVRRASPPGPRYPPTLGRDLKRTRQGRQEVGQVAGVSLSS